MSGFVSGSVWGLVLGSVGLVLASQLNDMPAGNEPPLTPQVTAPQAAMDETTPDVQVPDAPAAETALAVEVPRVAMPEAEVEAPLTDTSPPVPPTAPDISAALTLPEAVSDPEIATGLETPELSRTVISPPAVPQPEEDVVIATEPAQPAPEPVRPDSNEVAGVAEDTALEPPQQEDVVQETAEVVEADAPVAEVVTEPAPETAPEPDAVADQGIQDDVAATPETLETAEATPAEQDNSPDVTASPTVEDTVSEPAIIDVTDTADTPLPRVNTGVRVNRPGAAPTETAGQDAEVVVEQDSLEDAPALVRYATAFEATDDLPLMAILLLDGGQADGAARVAGLPFPATVVVDALAADANARMQAYRAAGVEVVMQTSLPAGAVPTDVEVAFEAAFDILPETVALFSGADGMLQNNRAVTAQVIEVLQSEGRGLIVVERGLSSAIRGAAQVGLPAVPVLRELDGGGEDAAAIGRALDQAAFRARQAGDGVLLARLTDQTVEALQTWGTENNGGQITLAPVSAILRGDLATE